VRDRRPPVRNCMRIEPIDHNRRTLAQHYRRKLARNRQIRRGLADELLQRAFTPERRRRHALRATTLLRGNARGLTATVARALGIERYTVEQVLRMLIERADRLGLHVRGNRRDALSYSRWMLERVTGLYSQGETPHLPL
jgi:ribosomal protein S15P/S13E